MGLRLRTKGLLPLKFSTEVIEEGLTESQDHMRQEFSGVICSDALQQAAGLDKDRRETLTYPYNLTSEVDVSHGLLLVIFLCFLMVEGANELPGAKNSNSN